MDIKNLKEANNLSIELKELTKSRDLLMSGGVLKVHGDCDVCATIVTNGKKEPYIQLINKRIMEILKRINEL